jgi:hypothetical protein
MGKKSDILANPAGAVSGGADDVVTGRVKRFTDRVAGSREHAKRRPETAETL